MSTTTAPPAPSGAGSAPPQKAASRINMNSVLVEGRALIALIIIIAIFTILSDNYLTAGNLTTITKQVAFNAIVALGMLVVILNGGIDLSVGSTVGLSAAVAGNLFRGVPIPGTDITMFPEHVGDRGHRGRGRSADRPDQRVTDSQAQSRPIHRHPGHAVRGPRADGGHPRRPEHHQRAERPGGSRQHRILRDLRQPAAGVADLGLVHDRPRHRLLAPVDPDPFRSLAVRHRQQRAGRPASGVPVKKVQIQIYVMAGLCAGVVGVLQMANISSSTADLGTFYELNAIAAVVIGGAALSGGRGTVRGTIIGAFVIGFLANGLVIVGVSPFWQKVITGAVIILAVAVDQIQQIVSRRRSARRAVASVRSSRPPAAATGGG